MSATVSMQSNVLLIDETAPRHLADEYRTHKVQIGDKSIMLFSWTAKVDLSANRYVMHEKWATAIGCRDEMSIYRDGNMTYYLSCQNDDFRQNANDHQNDEQTDHSWLLPEMCILMTLHHSCGSRKPTERRVLIDYRETINDEDRLVKSAQEVVTYLLPGDDSVATYRLPFITAIHDARFGAVCDRPLFHLVNFGREAYASDSQRADSADLSVSTGE